MAGSNRRGELAPVTSVDVVDPMTVRLNLDRAVRAAARAADRPRRHDGLAEGGAGRRRQVRRQAGLLGPVQVRRARGAGPHRAGALRRTTGTRTRSTSTRVIYTPIPDATVRLANLQVRASSISSSASRPPTWRRSRRRQKLQDLRRSPRSATRASPSTSARATRRKQKPLGQRPARARGVRAVDRPRRAGAGGDGQRSRSPATSGSRRPTPSTRRTCRCPSATSRARRQLLKEAGVPNPELHAADAHHLRRAAHRAGGAGDGARGRLRREDPGRRIRDLAQHGRQGRLRGLRARPGAAAPTRTATSTASTSASSRSTTPATACPRSTS